MTALEKDPTLRTRDLFPTRGGEPTPGNALGSAIKGRNNAHETRQIPILLVNPRVIWDMTPEERSTVYGVPEGANTVVYIALAQAIGDGLEVYLSHLPTKESHGIVLHSTLFNGVLNPDYLIANGFRWPARPGGSFVLSPALPIRARML